MQDKLLELHYSHMDMLKEESSIENKYRLLKKFAKEMIDQVDESNQANIIDAGTYIYGMCFTNVIGIPVEEKLPEFILKLSKLSVELEAYGMNTDGKLMDYWNTLKTYIQNLT